MKKMELLAPAGDMEKLKTALYFGADAVYIGGKNFSLRSYAANFSNEEIREALSLCRDAGKKLYVTVNIFARNDDLEEAADYFRFLSETGVDGAIVSDAGLLSVAREVAPRLKIDLSTQANTLNKRAAKFWYEQGVKRIVLARELSLREIKEIGEYLPGLETEVFVHGAMCISYSGRCLLSDYKTDRSGNRGECVQPCRWKYEIRERGSDGGFNEIEEDSRGTYIMNSKDLNLIDYLAELHDAGVDSLKIEGRMKSEYYVATVVNAYRRALDAFYREGADYKNNREYALELEKTSHREFTTAFLLGKNDRTVNYGGELDGGTKKYTALVIEGNENRNYAVVEMRNRFFKGDMLEVLSPTDNFKKTVKVDTLTTELGEEVIDAKIVKQRLLLFTDIPLFSGDMLRK